MLSIDRSDVDLLREAIQAQPGPFGEADVVSWFALRAPWVDPLWVEGTLVAGTVNDRDRRHFPGPRDLLFRMADGRLERYVRGRHGFWSKAGTPIMARIGKWSVGHLAKIEEALLGRRAS